MHQRKFFFPIVSIYFLLLRLPLKTMQVWKKKKDFLTESWYEKAANDAASKMLVTCSVLLNSLAKRGEHLEEAANNVMHTALNSQLSTPDRFDQVRSSGLRIRVI